MSFLYPAFLAGALAIAIPIALHLLRRDVAPEVPFTAVRLLRRSPMEQTRRKRLRDLLLLAARVAALLLLAAAFARPYFAAAAGATPLRIVAVDRSFSMGAPGRFERARALAREAVSHAGGPVAVIAFDERADVVALPGGEGEARMAIDGLHPGHAGTRFAPVFARVRELAGAGPAQVILISDLQRAGWADDGAAAVPRGVDVEVRAVDPVERNLAVTGVRTVPDLVSVSIANDSDTAGSGTVRLSVGTRTASVAFTAAPRATADVHVPFRVPDRGLLTAEIDDATGYAADNKRVLLLDDVRPRVLILSSPGSTATIGTAGGAEDEAAFYLSRALRSVEGAGAFDVRESTGFKTEDMDAAELARHAVVVLLSTRGLDRRAREAAAAFVRQGGGLLIVASGEVDPALIATAMGWSGFSAVTSSEPAGGLAPTDLRHPIFRPFGALSANLGQARFNSIWKVRTDGWEVAARFTNGSPALLERREGGGRVVLFASDLGRRWNDFPLHPAFVPFAVETVRHTSGRSEERREYSPADAPAGARPEPGVYDIGGRRVVVNVDPRESGTSVMSSTEFTSLVRVDQAHVSEDVEPRAQQVEGQQSLWRYGLLLMAVVLAAESIVGRTAW